MKIKLKGFTLIELLVVIAIIAVGFPFFVLALSNAFIRAFISFPFAINTLNPNFSNLPHILHIIKQLKVWILFLLSLP